MNQDKTISVIEQLKSEAEANFNASRWEDSAKTYEHLVRLAQDNDDLALAIDFALAAIRSWRKMVDKTERILKLYQVIGLLGLKQAAIGFETLARKAESENNQQRAAAIYEDAGEGYNYILNFDRARKCFMTSASILEKLSDEATNAKDLETAIHLYEKSSGIYRKLVIVLERVLVEQKGLDEKARKTIKAERNKVARSLKTARRKKAKSHEKLADDYLAKDDPDYSRIAEKEYSRALEIFEEIRDSQGAKRLRDKLKNVRERFSLK